MKTNRKRMSRSERQKQIKQVALDLFIKNGYKGTTTALIAKEAGISEVTLFRNFNSKREIFLQGVIPVLTETLEENLIVGDNESSKEALERFLVNRFYIISENYGIIRLVLMENQTNQELSDIDFIKTIGELIQSRLSLMGFKVNNKDFIMRLIMGSILSFLYLPEKNDELVKKFASELANTIDAMNK